MKNKKNLIIYSVIAAIIIVIVTVMLYFTTDVFKTKHANQFGAILEKMYRKYHDFHVQNGIATHDGCAIAYAIDSEMFDCVPAHMEVKYYKQYGTGVAVVDYKKSPNVAITTKVNTKKFKKLYFDSLKKCK